MTAKPFKEAGREEREEYQKKSREGERNTRKKAGRGEKGITEKERTGKGERGILEKIGMGEGSTIKITREGRERCKKSTTRIETNYIGRLREENKKYQKWPEVYSLYDFVDPVAF